MFTAAIIARKREPRTGKDWERGYSYSISRLFVYHHYMHGARGAIHYVYGRCGRATASLRGTTRGIAGQWRVYILKFGSDPPNAGHLRAIYVLVSESAQNYSRVTHAHIHSPVYHTAGRAIECMINGRMYVRMRNPTIIN